MTELERSDSCLVFSSRPALSGVGINLLYRKNRSEVRVGGVPIPVHRALDSVVSEKPGRIVF